MSVVLCRPGADRSHDLWISQSCFEWVVGLAKSQGIRFAEQECEDGQYTYVRLDDAEARRLVSLLECAISEVFAKLESCEAVTRSIDYCEAMLGYTRAGGWECMRP